MRLVGGGAPIWRGGLGLGFAGDGASFSVALTGLEVDSIGFYARIGNEASIGYSINPDNGTETVSWDDSNPGTGSDYGTGANPTDLTALSGSILFCHVTDGGETVSAAAFVRYAPGSAAGALPDQTGWEVGAAITPINPTGDFSLPNLTGAWSALGLPPGPSINPGTGEITGAPLTEGSGTITVIHTDQYGRTVSSSFSYSVTESVLADGVTWNGDSITWNGDPLIFTPATNEITWNGDPLTWNGDTLIFNAA